MTNDTETVESLREQLEEAGRQDGGGWPCACEFEPDEQKDPLVECLYHEQIRKLAEAAEARVMELGGGLIRETRAREAAEAKLAEEQELARWVESYGHPEEWVKRAQAAHNRAENLAAKLAEVEKALDSTTTQLHEVEKERDALVRTQYKANLRAASMDRARELAEKNQADTGVPRAALAEIARLLSGDE